MSEFVDTSGNTGSSANGSKRQAQDKNGFMMFMLFQNGTLGEDFLTDETAENIMGFLENNPNFAPFLRNTPFLQAHLSEAYGERFSNTFNHGVSLGGNFDAAALARLCPDQFNPSSIMSIASTDNAGSGYCAKGVANILIGTGMAGEDIRGNAHDWDDGRLERNGWVLVNDFDPTNAPPGSILLYDSDVHLGQRNRGTGGGSFGHVEIVVEDRDGDRFYVSDAARENYGGTVPDNFRGAYVYAPNGLDHLMASLDEDAAAEADVAPDAQVAEAARPSPQSMGPDFGGATGSDEPPADDVAAQVAETPDVDIASVARKSTPGIPTSAPV